MSDIKQVIVVRRDLNMRKGKMCAQVAHASTAWLRDGWYMVTVHDDMGEEYDYHHCFHMDSKEQVWFAKDYTKVVLWVRTEQELKDLYNLARYFTSECGEGLQNVYLQYDNGATEFHGEKTLTCLAIGPDIEEYIDKITGHLPLL